MAKDHGPRVKDDEQYESLREEGMSKEKAARIANEFASSSNSEVGSRGGGAEDYEGVRSTSCRTAPRSGSRATPTWTSPS